MPETRQANLLNNCGFWPFTALQFFTLIWRLQYFSLGKQKTTYWKLKKVC